MVITVAVPELDVLECVTCKTFNGLTDAASLAALRTPLPGAPTATRSIRQEVAEGVRWLWNRPGSVELSGKARLTEALRSMVEEGVK